jgi:phage shock protein PspC (stress-responsive transcriptional regulator)
MDGRMLAGVSSGLGAYFNVDPVVFRIAFVALTIAGGVGVFIYLLCWALFPPAYGPNPMPAVGAGGGQQAQALLQGALREGGWKTFLAIGAILLAVCLLFGPFARPSVVFALVLIALGVLLLIRDQPGDVRQPGQPGSGGPPPPGGGPAPSGGFPTGQTEPQGQWQASTSPPPAAAAPEATVPDSAPAPAAGAERVAAGAPGPYGSPGSAPAAWGQTVPWGQPSGWGQPPSGGYGSATERSGWGSAATAVMETVRQPRPRAIVGWVTVALALLAAGVAGALDNFGVVHMSAASTLALMLTVIGAGLMVASLWGRAGWLILVGLLLLPGVVVSSVVRDVGFTSQTGDVVERPTGVQEVLPQYKLGGGDLRIDLSAVQFDARKAPAPIDASVGAGELTVIVPGDQPVRVNARVSAGEIDIFESPTRDGLDLRTSVIDPPSSQPGRQLVLNLRVGVGTITVQRGEPPATRTAVPTNTTVPTSTTR